MGFFNSAAKALSPAYLFGSQSKGKNPADAASPYLNQIAPMAQQNLQPWQQQGQEAQQANQQQFNSMADNPSDFLAQLRATYSPSEGYKFKQAQMQKAMEGSAAAGGFRGTQSDQASQAALVKGLLGEDESDYINKILGIQGAGLQGRENMATRGYGAAGDLTNVLGSTLGAQGSLAYKGQENQNATKQAFQKMLMQLLGAGAGGAFGGPAGAQAGAGIGGAIGGGGYGGSPSNEQQFGFGWGR